MFKGGEIKAKMKLSLAFT